MECKKTQCHRPKHSKGLCSMHYQRLYKTGTTELIYYGKGGMRGVCSLNDCDKPHRAEGLCNPHYQLSLRVEPSPARLCDLSTCAKPHYGKGLCQLHYRRQRVWGDPRQDVPIMKRASTPEAKQLKRRIQQSKRRERVRNGTPIPFTPEQLEQRISMFPTCYLCGVAPSDSIDHVKPLSKGGLNILANMKGACISCNSSKGNDWTANEDT